MMKVFFVIIIAIIRADGKNFYQYSLENIIRILGQNSQDLISIYDGPYAPKPNTQFPKLKLLVFTRKNLLKDLKIRWETIDVENLGEYTTELNQFPTVLYIYGFLDRPTKFTSEGIFDSTSATLVAGTYFQRNFLAAYIDYYGLGFLVDTSSLYTNVVVVDWSEYNTNYFTSLTNLPAIANVVGDKLYAMSQDLNSLNLNSWHFVGHSLGAHMVGLIARRIKDRTGTVVIPRVTGLDPAGPIIEFVGIRDVYPRLGKDCGK